MHDVPEARVRSGRNVADAQRHGGGALGARAQPLSRVQQCCNRKEGKSSVGCRGERGPYNPSTPAVCGLDGTAAEDCLDANRGVGGGRGRPPPSRAVVSVRWKGRDSMRRKMPHRC